MSSIIAHITKPWQLHTTFDGEQSKLIAFVHCFMHSTHWLSRNRISTTVVISRAIAIPSNAKSIRFGQLNVSSNTDWLNLLCASLSRPTTRTTKRDKIESQWIACPTTFSESFQRFVVTEENSLEYLKISLVSTARRSSLRWVFLQLTPTH